MMGIFGRVGRFAVRRRVEAYPLLDNLIAYWNLDEASGQRNDSHTNALHLTDNNTVGVSSGGGPDGGDAANFVAANSEYLSRVDNADLSAGDVDFSVAGWMYLSDKGNYRVALSKWKLGGTSDNEWVLEYDPSPTDRMALYVSADGVVIADSMQANNFGSPPTNTWFFVVAWHDSVSNTINMQANNGSVDSKAYSSGIFDGAAKFIIGGHDMGAPLTWDGRIAYAGFWKRILTAAERTWLYNSGSGRDYAAVAAYTG